MYPEFVKASIQRFIPSSRSRSPGLYRLRIHIYHTYVYTCGYRRSEKAHQKKYEAEMKNCRCNLHSLFIPLVAHPLSVFFRGDFPFCARPFIPHPSRPPGYRHLVVLRFFCSSSIFTSRPHSFYVQWNLPESNIRQSENSYAAFGEDLSPDYDRLYLECRLKNVVRVIFVWTRFLSSVAKTWFSITFSRTSAKKWVFPRWCEKK